MGKTFNLTIISPEKIIFNAETVSLIAPCETGYLGILADHQPLAAKIIEGKIIIRNNSAEQQVIDCGTKGFLEVLNNKVNLFLNSGG